MNINFGLETIDDSFRKNRVKPGNSAPILSNITLNFGTIPINKPRLTEMAKRSTKTG